MPENIHVTSAREDTYRLLAACFYPPTQELIAENCCATLAALLIQSAPDAACHAKEAAQVMGDALEPLTVEHARLFMGPFFNWLRLPTVRSI